MSSPLHIARIAVACSIANAGSHLFAYGDCRASCTNVLGLLHFQPMAKAERMLTVREVAERLSAGQSSVRIWARKGRFKGARLEDSPIGTYWLIPESALKGFVMRGIGRPRKPLSELKSKPRRKD